MISLITWNIQCGRGVDGVVDLNRIAQVIVDMGGADIVCLQEVARHDPDGDGIGADQVAQLSELFPDHRAVFGAAYDRWGKDGTRRQFGNMILSRRPILQSFVHSLPQPPAPGVKHMPRQATEVVVDMGGFPLRVITTHLEFHSAEQRLAQVARLRDLHREAAANALHPGLNVTGPYAPWPRPTALILCGDFNFAPSDPGYAQILAPFAHDIPSLADCWPLLHGRTPHPKTCGIFDHTQWPQGAHCRDYVFLGETLQPLAAQMTVDEATAASDHQPLRLRLHL